MLQFLAIFESEGITLGPIQFMMRRLPFAGIKAVRSYIDDLQVSRISFRSETGTLIRGTSICNHSLELMVHFSAH